MAFHLCNTTKTLLYFRIMLPGITHAHASTNVTDEAQQASHADTPPTSRTHRALFVYLGSFMGENYKAGGSGVLPSRTTAAKTLPHCLGRPLVARQATKTTPERPQKGGIIAEPAYLAPMERRSQKPDQRSKERKLLKNHSKPDQQKTDDRNPET